MPIDTDVQRHHAEVGRMANALLTALRGSERPPANLGAMRMALATASRDALSSVEAMSAQLGPDMRAQLPGFDRVTQSERGIRFLYSEHIGRWSTPAIERDFAGYVKAVEVLVAKLDDHRRVLEAELYEPASRLTLTAANGRG